MLTKLDFYECKVLPGKILIAVTGPGDPTLTDVLTEVRNSEGRIYVEDNYYLYLKQHEVLMEKGVWTLVLDVVSL